MAERQTLLSRPSGAPLAQPIQSQAQATDHRGLQQFGGGLQDAGSSMMRASARLSYQSQQMAAQKDARDEHDARLITDRLLAEAAVEAKTEWDSRIGGTSPDEIMSMTDEVLTGSFGRIAEKMSTQTNPALPRVATQEYLASKWVQSTDSLIIHANKEQGAIKVKTREDDAQRLMQAWVNFAGNDTTAALNAAKASFDLTGEEKAGYYSRDFPQRMKDGIASYLPKQFMGAIKLNGGLTPTIANDIIEAHGLGFVSTDELDDMYLYGRQANEVSRANATAAVTQHLDTLGTGKVAYSETVRGQIHAASGLDPKREPDLIAKLDRQILVKAATGVIAGRSAKGLMAFPWNDEVDTKTQQVVTPSIFVMMDRLKPGAEEKDILSVMNTVLEGKASATFTADEVEEFRADAYEAVSKQVNKINGLKGHEIALMSNQVQGMMAYDSVPGQGQHTFEQYKQAYQAWFDHAGIPLEKQVIIHTPHLNLVKQAYGKGNVDDFMGTSEAVTRVYDPVAIGRAFSGDKDARHILPVMRVLAQLNMTSNPRVQEGGIKTFARKLAESAFHYASNSEEMEKSHKGEVSKAGKMFSESQMGNPGLAGVKAVNSFAGKFASFGLVNPEQPSNDLRVPVILSVLTNESPEVAAAFSDALAYAAVQDAYGPGGTQNLAVSVQQLSNSLFSSFTPIRTGGMYSERPAFVLIPADMQNRGSFDNFVFGGRDNEATSLVEAKTFTESAFDGIFIDGIQDVKYSASGGFGLSHLDNYLAAGPLQKIGYRANGYENNSFLMSGINESSPAARLPLQDRIPFQDLVLSDTYTSPETGREVTRYEPLAKSPVYFKSTFSDAVKDYVKKNITGQAGTDLHSMNHQVLSKNRVLRQMPNGDFQVFLNPVSKKTELVDKGVVTQYAPVMVQVRDASGKLTGKVKPLIIPKKSLIRFRDTQIDARTPRKSYTPLPQGFGNSHFSQKTSVDEIPPYPTDRSFFDK